MYFCGPPLKSSLEVVLLPLYRLDKSSLDSFLPLLDSGMISLVVLLRPVYFGIVDDGLVDSVLSLLAPRV